jgi:hypothetical protein
LGDFSSISTEHYDKSIHRNTFYPSTLKFNYNVLSIEELYALCTNLILLPTSSNLTKLDPYLSLTHILPLPHLPFSPHFPHHLLFALKPKPIITCHWHMRRLRDQTEDLQISSTRPSHIRCACTGCRARCTWRSYGEREG